LISGTCEENVSIPPGKDRLTLDGRGSGVVVGPDVTVNTIQVRGPRAVTITGLTIRGGRVGIDVSRGSSAVIDGNSIEGSARNGITLGSFATANIVNNTIRNNASAGILVTGNAFGFIGFATADDTAASPNAISTTVTRAPPSRSQLLPALSSRAGNSRFGRRRRAARELLPELGGES
jgi:hypothetical protein